GDCDRLHRAAAAIGIWAPILLVLLRLVQSIDTGAEFGGAITMIAEFATPRRCGLLIAWDPPWNRDVYCTLHHAARAVPAAGLAGPLRTQPLDRRDAGALHFRSACRSHAIDRERLACVLGLRSGRELPGGDRTDRSRGRCAGAGSAEDRHREAGGGVMRGCN